MLLPNNINDEILRKLYACDMSIKWCKYKLAVFVMKYIKQAWFTSCVFQTFQIFPRKGEVTSTASYINFSTYIS